MENHHFSRVNTLFLWPSSIAFCQRLPEGIHLNAAAGAQKKSRIKVLKCPFAALGAKRNSGQNMPESGGTANSSQKIKKNQVCSPYSHFLESLQWPLLGPPFWSHLEIPWSHDPHGLRFLTTVSQQAEAQTFLAPDGPPKNDHPQGEPPRCALRRCGEESLTGRVIHMAGCLQQPGGRRLLSLRHKIALKF
jgi:hypothetical protein